MSYEEYLHDPSIDAHTEWVGGAVVAMAPVDLSHALLCSFVQGLLGMYVNSHSLGVLLRDPFQMKTGPALPGRAPDFIFIRSEHLDRLHDLFLEGPADLAIEIISPGTEGVDRGDKFYEYEQGGVPEYWILDPHRQVAEFYARDENGVYRSANVPPDGEFESLAVPGFRLKVEWLWSGPSAMSGKQ
jgi:Uma2 family endonuclease